MVTFLCVSLGGVALGVLIIFFEKKRKAEK
jgi:hypothetical protein